MKWAAIVMAVVMVAALAGTVYLYLNTTIRVEKLGLIATEADTQQTAFDSLREQMAADRVIGTVFQRDSLEETGEYQFLTYTVRLNNGTAFTADMVEVQITPMPQDVLQLGDETARALPGRSSGEISATILTRKGGNTVRELTITYYIWGVPFTLHAVYRH